MHKTYNPYWLHNRIKENNKKARLSYKQKLKLQEELKKKRERRRVAASLTVLNNMVKKTNNLIRKTKKEQMRERYLLKNYESTIPSIKPVYSTLDVESLEQCTGVKCPLIHEPNPYSLTIDSGRIWDCLKKSWLGYKISLDPHAYDHYSAVKYAVLIQKFSYMIADKDLRLVPSFPSIGLSNYGEKYANTLGEFDGSDNN